MLKRSYFFKGLITDDVPRISTGFRARDCVLPQCGFVEEGREREAVLVADGWQGDLIMGLLDQGTNIGPCKRRGRRTTRRQQ